MIIVRAQMTISADQRAPFLSYLQAFMQASRAEAGCTSFGCYEDVEAPNAFTVLTEWRDQTSLDRHEQSSHLTQFKANISAMIVSRQETRVYTVSGVGSLNLNPK